MEQSYVKTDFENENLEVRFIQQLKIRIGDAKNLLPKNGANFLKDCFCIIKLDREEIFRTHCSNEKTLHPFFGEEFNFDIPRVFRFFSIYVYERERTVNTIRNRPLGKVTIRRSQLCKFSSEEAWFPLIPINYNSEIQGKINLLIEPKYILSSNALFIIVKVFECQDLTVECCDSHVAIQLKVDDAIYNKKSKVKRKTSNPQYNESFYFELPLNRRFFDNTDCQYMCQQLLASAELKLFVMHDSCGRSSNNFLGEVRIPMSKLELNEAHKAWYFLQPKSFTHIKGNSNLGSLRLRINYISDYVFPSHLYDCLRNLLLSSAEIKPITCSTGCLLGEFVLDKTDAAQPLVKIFLHYRKLVPFIRYLAESEIANVTDANLIFRGNSLVSKCIDTLMKLVGIRYLHQTLKGCVETVILEQKSCEIDPNRIKENESLESNMDNLKKYISNVFHSITLSMTKCPQIMREVFSVLKELTKERFPDNTDACYYVISGFVFLRFFAPAILNPPLFDLTDLNINPQTNRTFTLISKTIQSIGNLVVSKKNATIIKAKESYMMSLFDNFITEQHVLKTKEFLKSISTSSQITTKEAQEPIVLKESIMYKKCTYMNGFGTAFRKRFFSVTTHHFFYSKAKTKTPLFKFPINEISVRKLPDSFNSRNMFQVIHSRCTLHIQAKNCVQEKEWLDTLSRLIDLNQCQNSMNKMHPSSLEDKYDITPDLSIMLDADRELERIHCLFVSNQVNMQAIMDACEKGLAMAKIWKGYGKTHASQFEIVNRQSLANTLGRLRECVTQLEKHHQTFLERVHGTEKAPIEVDSYSNGNSI